MASYLTLIAIFIWWFLKYGRSNENDALFAGWISILITNFFGFSVVIIQLLFFLIPAIMFLREKEKSYTTVDLENYQAILTVLAWVVPLLGVTMLIILARLWQADTLYAAGYRATQTQNIPEVEILTTQAIAMNPGEPVYHDQLASALSALTLSALDQKNATLAASLAKQSLAESDIALRTSPNNVNFWKTRTKIYYSFSSFDPNLNGAAIQALEKAQTLSPNDPKILYNLAILYGRAGKNDHAIDLLKQAKVLKTDYRDAYFGLYVFYTEEKNNDAARAIIQEYLTKVDPTDRDFQDRLNKLSP